MKQLLIAIGNRLRRDDGAASRVLDLLGLAADVETRRVVELTPELAEEVAAADRVVFLDADVNPGEARIEPLDEAPARPAPLGHAIEPAEVIALARALFGFRGDAWLCRIPGGDFGQGEGLSPAAERNARRAARALRRLIGHVI